MDRVVAARKLIGDLVKVEQIEVRRVEIVGRDLVKLLDTLRRPPTGQELGEWFEEHPQVTEITASTAILDELVDRYLVDRKATANVTATRNPDLERQLRADPANVGPYLVYADWLQEHADPLGELIALSVAAANGNNNDSDVGRFERHLKRYEAFFLGESGAELASRVRFGWRFGFVQSLDVGDLEPPMWNRLLGLRVCELLESITLRGPCSASVDVAIASAAPDSLRGLALEVVDGPLPTHLLRRPLRALFVRGRSAALASDTFPSSLERLELLVFEASSRVPLELGVRDLAVYATESNVAFLRQTKWPSLERLTLDHVGAGSAAVDVLENIGAPALAHVEIRNGRLEASTFGRLAELPLAARLRSLGLVNLELTDDTIAPIARTRGFSSLEQVDVTQNELTRNGLALARELAPTVISARQLRPGHHVEQRVRKLAGIHLTAAEEIADPKEWRRAGVDGDLRWARYRGDADYELFITADLSRYGCTCPSSTQPCKHVIALALVAERTGLPAAPSNGVELRVTTRAGLNELLLASIDVGKP